MEKRRLREVILDNIEAKDLKLEEVIEKTGIPEQYMDAILHDRRERLPAFPYVRMHLVRLAELLSLDTAEVIAQYKAEFSDKVSGAADMLPGNRFALPSSRRRYLIAAGILALIIFGYAISNSGFFGKPHIVLTMPPQDSSDPYIIEQAMIELKGQIDPGDKLLINGQPTPVSSEGVFTLEYQLQPELNTVEFTVSRFLGREVKLVRQIYYKEPVVAEVEALEEAPISTESLAPDTIE